MKKISNPNAIPELREKLNGKFQKMNPTGKLLNILGVTRMDVYAVTELDKAEGIKGHYYYVIAYRKWNPLFFFVVAMAFIVYLLDAIGAFFNDFPANFLDGGKIKLL